MNFKKLWQGKLHRCAWCANRSVANIKTLHRCDEPVEQFGEVNRSCKAHAIEAENDYCQICSKLAAQVNWDDPSDSPYDHDCRQHQATPDDDDNSGLVACVGGPLDGRSFSVTEWTLLRTFDTTQPLNRLATHYDQDVVLNLNAVDHLEIWRYREAVRVEQDGPDLNGADWRSVALVGVA